MRRSFFRAEIETHRGERREMPDRINRIFGIILSNSGPPVVGVVALCQEAVLWERGT